MSLESLKPKVEALIEMAKNSSGGNTGELEVIIDNSGVLDSTDGTIEEKVEQVVDMAELILKTNAISFRNDKTIERINFYLSNNYGSLMNAFANTTNLKFMVVSFPQ